MNTAYRKVKETINDISELPVFLGIHSQVPIPIREPQHTKLICLEIFSVPNKEK
jgi:hypothetical protein